MANNPYHPYFQYYHHIAIFITIRWQLAWMHLVKGSIGCTWLAELGGLLDARPLSKDALGWQSNISSISSSRSLFCGWPAELLDARPIVANDANRSGELEENMQHVPVVKTHSKQAT